MAEFVDGVSVEPVPRRIADRIAAAVQVVEVNADGSETASGPADRLVHGATIRAEKLEPLATATEEELAAERARDAEKAKRPVADKLYTKQELEDLADKEGIKGLREVAKAWQVRGRAIPELIADILKAQSQFTNRVEQATAAELAQKEADAAAARKADEEREASISALARIIGEPAKEPAAPVEPVAADQDAAANAPETKADEPKADEPASDEPKSDESKDGADFVSEDEEIKSTEA